MRAPKRAAEPYFKEFPAAEVRQQIVASEPAGSSKLDLSVVTVTIFSPEQLEGTMELSAAEREFHETFNAAFDASAKETDARDFHQHMTPPVRGRGVPKDDWTQYELAGGRMQAQNSTGKNVMSKTQAQLVQRLGKMLGMTEGQQRNGNMLRLNLHPASQFERALKVSKKPASVAEHDLDVNNLCVIAACGVGRTILFVPAQTNAFRKHAVVSEASDHGAHHDHVYPYASEHSEITQQALVIFVDTEENGRRRSFQCFYNTADLELVDPPAVAQQFRTLAGVVAVDMA